MLASADWAKRAIDYTKKELGYYPSNHPAMKGSEDQCVARIRSLSPFDKDKHRKALLKDSVVIDYIKVAAEQALKGDCGNCGEYAAVVFYYLMQNACQMPIEYCSYAKGGDHAFVVIGRDSKVDISKPTKWNSDCRIADAWTGAAVDPGKYWVEMPAYPDKVYAPRVHARRFLLPDIPQRSKMYA